MRVRTHVNPLTYITRMDIDYSKVLDFKKKFIDIEIGIGNADFIISYAKKNNDRNIIGIEIRKPLALRAKEIVIEENISNICIVHGRAEICLEDTINNNSIDRIFLFHPDPWIKKKHHKRRVIQKEFVNLIFHKLKANGIIYISTDVYDLWQYMRNILLDKFIEIQSDLFWNQEYMTHWTKYSKKENRNIYYGSFSKKNTV